MTVQETGHVDHSARPAGSPEPSQVRERPLRVLHVEDDPLVAELVARTLGREGGGAFLLNHQHTLGEALSVLTGSSEQDVMLVDLNLPDSEGWNTFEHLHSIKPDLPMVILTGEADQKLVARAVQEGAQDFLAKSELRVSGLLARIIRYAVERQAGVKQLDTARKQLLDQNMRLEQALAELEKTSAALVETEKMKSLGQMTAGIAHELKNPLAIIRMGMDYLDRAKPEKAHAAIARIMPDLMSAMQRSDQLIADMMDYSAPRSLKTEVVSLNSVIEEAVSIMRPLFLKHNVELDLDLAALSPDLDLDRRKVVQLMLNLMGNAVHAMPEGGGLRVSTRTGRTVDGNSNGPIDPDLPDLMLLVVEVHDDGPGIPEEHLKKVFDPFFTTKGASGGTGLGLAVCRMIMEQHGGKLELFNHPEGGAVARLTFII